MDAEYSSGVFQYVSHACGKVVLSNAQKEFTLQLKKPPQGIAYGEYVSVHYKDGIVIDISQYEIPANQLQDAVLVAD
jgi:hypothetical protein